MVVQAEGVVTETAGLFQRHRESLSSCFVVLLLLVYLTETIVFQYSLDMIVLRVSPWSTEAVFFPRTRTDKKQRALVSRADKKARSPYLVCVPRIPFPVPRGARLRLAGRTGPIRLPDSTGRANPLRPSPSAPVPRRRVPEGDGRWTSCRGDSTSAE